MTCWLTGKCQCDLMAILMIWFAYAKLSLTLDLFFSLDVRIRDARWDSSREGKGFLSCHSRWGNLSAAKMVLLLILIHIGNEPTHTRHPHRHVQRRLRRRTVGDDVSQDHDSFVLSWQKHIYMKESLYR